MLRRSHFYISHPNTIENEDPRDIIFFHYNNGCEVKKVTITSKSHKHWRQATIYDGGSVVFLRNSMDIDSKLKFGELGGID